MQIDQNSLPGGPGIVEEGIHPASGLRSIIQTGTLANHDACVASAQVANASSWTVLPLSTMVGLNPWGVSSTSLGTQTLYRGRLPFPCTPCITYRQTNATPNNTQVFSIKVFGYDQFGQFIYETVENQTTAAATIGTPTLNYIRRTRLWLSKVFAVITRIEYKLATAQSTDDYIDVGVAWNPDFLNATWEPYTNYIGQLNQGIGSPLRLAPYGPAQPFAGPELLGIELTNTTPQVHPIQLITVSNPSIVRTGNSVGGVGNTPLATPSGIGLNIPIVSYTAANPTVITLNAAVSIGFAVGQRIRIRISGEVGTPGINGEWLATVTDVTAGAVKFSIPANVTVAGSVAGMLIYLLPLWGANSSAATAQRSYEPVIVGGVNANTPATINGFHQAILSDHWGITVPINTSVAGTDGYIQMLNQPKATVHAYDSSLLTAAIRGGFRVGQNASGFRGTANKWHILRACTTSSLVNGYGLHSHELPYLDATYGIMQQFPWFFTDTIEFRAYYRTSRGTIRGNNGRSSYAT